MALCSTFPPPTSANRMWAEFQSISTGLEGFCPGATPVFLPLQKSTLSQLHLAGLRCSGIIHDRLVAAIEAPFTCIRSILASRVGPEKPLGEGVVNYVEVSKSDLQCKMKETVDQCLKTFA